MVDRPPHARPAAEPRGRSPLIVAALLAGVFAFGLARWALLPGLGFWDTGEFQTVGPALGTAHPTGFPAYVVLGWLASIVLAPFGDPAFRMNLLSAVLVGGAAGLAVVLARQLTGRLLVALAIGLVMGAVPIVWNIGTHADAHALHLLLVALVFVLLIGWEQRVRAARRIPAIGRASAAGWAPTWTPTNAPSATRRLGQPGDRWLLAATIVYGVGLANHTLMLLLAPGIGLFVLATAPAILRRPRFVGGLAGAMLLTALALYLELPLRAGIFRAPLVYGHPERLDGFLYVVLAQQFFGALHQPFANLGTKAAELARLGFEQLGPLVVLVPLGFVATMWRQPRYAVLSGVSFLVTAWFAASYDNADIARYYLGPALMALTWLAILAGVVLALFGRIADRFLGVDAGMDPELTGPPVRPDPAAGNPAMLILEIAVGLAILMPTIQAIPERADAENLSTQTTASDWAHTAMNVFAPDAVVVSWWSYSTTLWYAQIIEGRRPDVWIVDDRTRLDEKLGEVTDVIDAELGRRPVYAVRLEGDDDLVAVLARYEVQRIDMPTEQPIYLILGRRP